LRVQARGHDLVGAAQVVASPGECPGGGVAGVHAGVLIEVMAPHETLMVVADGQPADPRPGEGGDRVGQGGAVGTLRPAAAEAASGGQPGCLPDDGSTPA
jgi:hypothetical protein